MSTPAPLAVIMISLNEAHNMEAVLENLNGFAREVFLLDSFSSDATVDIALAGGVHVVQRRFRGFGDQWNFALNHMPVTAPWVMKLDPDERLTDELKTSIRAALAADRGWLCGKAPPLVHGQNTSGHAEYPAHLAHGNVPVLGCAGERVSHC